MKKQITMILALDQKREKSRALKTTINNYLLPDIIVASAKLNELN